ncbi:FAD/NAD(P)-binding oxidoreductase [Legionella brunensis]|uniref:Uncharacterized protein n=1 Tax=Legionella brunensis TaxID=29422 RepID=A0A0W0S330_9GAMM|nr:FAD/NAD(P)-binding oxidoreductase [Legionella brunensis]KTC77900.1 hypothetical protein Lbru_2793 [Legionella brunensis]
MPYDVVVSGAGPAGLAVAFEAVKRRKSVLVINDRKLLPVRTQFVALDIESIKYLKGMMLVPGKEKPEKKRTEGEKEEPLSEDEKNKNRDLEKDNQFLSQLSSSHSRVAIKDIEQFIQRRIAEHQTGNIQFRENAKIESLDMSTGILKITDNSKPIQFTTLIGADGTKHHAANKVNEWHENNYPVSPQVFEYKKVEGPDYNLHGSFNFILKSKTGEILDFPEKTFVVGKTLALNGMLTFDEHSYEKNNESLFKCSFATELPPYLYHLINQYNKADDKKRNDIEKIIYEEVSLFIRTALEGYSENTKLDMNDTIIDFSPVNLEKAQKNPEKAKQKNKLKIQAFTTELYEASHAVYSHQQAHTRYLSTGDSYRSPNYQIGQGINNTFAQAQAVGQVLDGKKSLEEYEKLCKTLSEDMTDKTGLFRNVLKGEYKNDIKPSNMLWHHLFGNSPSNLTDFIKNNQNKLTPAHYQLALDIALQNNKLDMVYALYQMENRKDFTPDPILLQAAIITALVDKDFKKYDPTYIDWERTRNLMTLIEVINFNTLTLDANKSTLLHYLAEKNYPDLMKTCIKQLQKNGVNVEEALSQKNAQGKSVVDILKENNVNISSILNAARENVVHTYKNELQGMGMAQNNHQSTSYQKTSTSSE